MFHRLMAIQPGELISCDAHISSCNKEEGQFNSIVGPNVPISAHGCGWWLSITHRLSR